MSIKIQMITTMVLFLLAGNAFTQSITVPTEPVDAGDTANVVLSYTAGGATDNFNFRLFYDETVVDETALSLGVVCDSAAIGITELNCSVDTVLNRISGIGVNLGGPLTSGDFATVTLPTLAGASLGDSVNAIEIIFAAGIVGTSDDSMWALTITQTGADSDGDGIPDDLDATPNTPDPNFCTGDNAMISGTFFTGTQTVCRANLSIVTNTNLVVQDGATLVLIAPDVIIPSDFTSELGSILLILQQTPE